MVKQPDPVEAEFQRVISQWETTLLTDTPQVRSIFAAAAAYVLIRLGEKPSAKERSRIINDFRGWIDEHGRDWEVRQ